MDWLVTDCPCLYPNRVVNGKYVGLREELFDYRRKHQFREQPDPLGDRDYCLGDEPL